MSTLEPAAQSKPPGGFKLWLSQLQMKHGRKLVIALPYIWLILLFLLPFLIQCCHAHTSFYCSRHCKHADTSSLISARGFPAASTVFILWDMYRLSLIQI